MNITHDLVQFFAETKWTQTRLAKEAGIHIVSLNRLTRGHRKGCSSATLEKLWPFLYGDKRPAVHED